MQRRVDLMNHLASRRGRLIVGTALSLALGIGLDGRLGNVFLVIAGFLACSVLFAVSNAITVLHQRVSQIEQTESKKSTSTKPTSPSSTRVARVESKQTWWPSPAVTIVVPAFNEAAHVLQTLESVIAQSFGDWECLVVDDASTDESLQLIARAAHRESRIRVLRHRVNSGLAASRNTGLRLARGQFVTFLDSDDLLTKSSLEDRLAPLVETTNDEHVIGSYTGVAYRGEDIHLDELPTAIGWPSPERIVIDFVSANGECPFPAMAPLLRTEALRQLGGFDESMKEGAEDWDLWQRTLRNGYTFVPSSMKTAVYRQRTGSMIRQNSDAHARIGLKLIEASHEEARPSILTAPSPTPLPRPIAFYSKRITQSRRAIRFAAMAYGRGDVEEASNLLDPLRALPRALLVRHVDVRDEVLRGLTRADGSDPGQPGTASSGQIDDITEWVLTHASEVTGTLVAPSAHFQLLLIPQHAGHLKEMLETTASQGGTADFAVMLLEREGGDQGVSSLVPDGVPVFSLNQWILGGSTCDSAMVGQIRSWIVEETALQLRASGAQIREIPDSYAAVKLLPDARQRTSTVPATHLSPDTHDEPVSAPPSADLSSLEEDPRFRVDFERVRELRNRYQGERVVLIGNGPSLNNLDLTLLKAELTFGVNGIFYASGQMGFAPTFYVVEDSAVVQDNLEALRAYPAGHKLFPSVYRDEIGELDDATYFLMNRGFYEPESPNFCVPNFATDCTSQVFCGQSVTIINLQLAFHMGFTEVVLIGMDFSYKIPDDALQSGSQIISQSPDPNHFHPDYFGRGKVWKQPRLDRVLACYALAKQIYEAGGRRIVNATPGGELHLFDRVEFTRLFS